jgi:hypothetical protein
MYILLLLTHHSQLFHVATAHVLPSRVLRTVLITATIASCSVLYNLFAFITLTILDGCVNHEGPSTFAISAVPHLLLVFLRYKYFREIFMSTFCVYICLCAVVSTICIVLCKLVTSTCTIQVV